MVCSLEDGKEFLSTPSVRRATGRWTTHEGLNSISIHALREEGDLKNTRWRTPHNGFLSTPSVRRATEKNDWM